MSRSHVVLICKIGTAVSLLAVVAIFLWADSYLFKLDPYLFKLGACFLLFLFAFHWFFGAKRNLTVTHARLIDYAYLGIAAVGVFVLALNYEEKRYEYTQLEAQDEARRHLQKSVAQLKEAVSDVERAACVPIAVQLIPEYCEKVKELKVALAAEDFSEANKDYSHAVKAYLENVAPPNTADEAKLQLYRQIDSANLWLKSYQTDIEFDFAHIEVQAPLPPAERGETTIYGLFTWPFILAFAFALRITKTTIEVLDWTASKPAASQPPPSSRPA